MVDLVHLDEEQVQRLLHGELTPPSSTSVRDHLASCAECSARVAAAEREEAWVLHELSRLDHPTPAVHVAAVMKGRRGVPWVRWAAGILLAIGAAGAAYAAPGSPLRRLVDRVAVWLAGDQPRAPGRPLRQPGDSVTRGIAISPGRQFTIAIAPAQRDGVVIASITEGAEIVVRALGGAATFTSDVDRLSVDNTGASVRFEIEIPARAPHVEIWVGGRRVFAKDESRVLTDGWREADGRYLVPFWSGPR
jgi:Putative zinc-finger